MLNIQSTLCLLLAAAILWFAAVPGPVDKKPDSLQPRAMGVSDWINLVDSCDESTSSAALLGRAPRDPRLESILKRNRWTIESFERIAALVLGHAQQLRLSDALAASGEGAAAKLSGRGIVGLIEESDPEFTDEEYEAARLAIALLEEHEEVSEREDR